MEAYYDKSLKLITIGFMIFIIGFIILLLGSLIQFGMTGSNASVSGGVLILIGPIPIGLAFGQYNWLIMLILMIIAIILIIIMFFIIRYSKFQ